MQRIFIAGHNGMVGSALSRQLSERSDCEVITRERSRLDLTSQQSVQDFFTSERLDAVIIAAAKVGGIHANNTCPAEFIYENLIIECNLIHAAHKTDVPRLMFLGSSCIYPKLAPQPMAEDALLTGALEPTNEPYAIAKIAGIKLCESYYRQYGRDYRSVMPTNLYGPGDNYHPENSHVIPALIRRLHEAKVACAEEVKIWGTGSPKREFLHVDDMAAATLHVMGLPYDHYWALLQNGGSHVNIGTGQDCTIRELAETIADVVGYEGRLKFDANKPDGAPRKLLDVSRLTSLGWQARISLRDGLKNAYTNFLNEAESLRQ